MKLSDPSLELQACISVVASKDEDVPIKLLGLLHKRDFGYEHTRAIYDRVRSLVRRGKAVPSLKVIKHDASLSEEARSLLKEGKIRPLNRLEDVDHLLESLHKYRHLRLLYNHSKDVVRQLKSSDLDIGKITLETEDLLFKLKNDTAESIVDHAGAGGNSNELTEEILDDKDVGDVIRTGFDNFDKPSGAWRKGQFIVIASHKKGGKSITALNMATNQYLKYNLSPLTVVLEMSRKECRQRLLSLLSGVPFEKFYKRELGKSDRKLVRQVWKEFNQHGKDNGCRFSVWRPAECTVGDIVFKFKPMGYDVIYVDYVNLLTPADVSQKGSNDWQVLSTFYKQLKETATQLDCTVVGLTQMNTDGSIRYSGAALEDCDCAITWYYQEEEMATHIIECNVVVARNFRPFAFSLQEDFARMSLSDYSGPAPGKGKDGDDDIESMPGI